MNLAEQDRAIRKVFAFSALLASVAALFASVGLIVSLAMCRF